MHESICSPASVLASFLSNRKETPELVLVTGRSGSGKTTWCLELIRQAQAAGVFPLGFVSAGVFEDGRKVALDLLEIHTGERRRLALRRPEAARASRSGRHTRAWQFDAGVLDWANRSLESLDAGDLLILDELGPLEFLENRGLVSGLKLVDDRRFQPAFVVVRPALLATARVRWPWGVALDLAEPAFGLEECGP